MFSNNVIVFPGSYSGPMKEDVSVEKIAQNIDTMKQFHIQETLTNVVPIVFTHLNISGFSLGDDDPEDDKTLKDGALIVEAIRSFMCKYYGIYHPFQRLAENIFESDNEEPETLNIVDNLTIKLKDEETTS